MCRHFDFFELFVKLFLNFKAYFLNSEFLLKIHGPTPTIRFQLQLHNSQPFSIKVRAKQKTQEQRRATNLCDMRRKTITDGSKRAPKNMKIFL